VRLGACLINGLLRRLGFNPYCYAMAIIFPANIVTAK
jgi:hypothetical protein